MGRGASFWSALAVAAAIAIAACYKAVLRISPIQPLPVFLPPALPLTGALTPKPLHIQRIGEGLLPYPEDIVVDANGFLLVSCADGWIKRVDPASNSIDNWVHLGAGRRPLGLALGRYGEVIVCDPDMGLLNVTQQKIEILSQEAEGVRFLLTDAAGVSMDDGSIYFTDASNKYPLAFWQMDVFEARPNGRLLKYDPNTRTTKVLLDRLYFANGVHLSKNQEFLVFCESTMARCRRYWIKGEKAGHVEIFIDNLPGFPDNIKADGKGRFWIAHFWDRPFYVELMLKYPFLKQLLYVLKLNNLMSQILQKRSLIMAVTEEGEPLSTVRDPTGIAIQFITTALVVDDNLYLGNLAHDFIGYMKLNDSSIV